MALLIADVAEHDFGWGIPLADGVLDLPGFLWLSLSIQMKICFNYMNLRLHWAKGSDTACLCPASNPRSDFVYTIIFSFPAKASSNNGFLEVIGTL